MIEKKEKKKKGKWIFSYVNNQLGLQQRTRLVIRTRDHRYTTGAQSQVEIRDNKPPQERSGRARRTWPSSGFVHDDEVCHVVGFARPHQPVDLVVPSVHALRSGEHQLQLL